MLYNSYSYEILYEQFHLIYLQEDVKLLLVTVNNMLKFEIEIVHDLSCHTMTYSKYKKDAENSYFLPLQRYACQKIRGVTRVGVTLGGN